MLDIVPFATQPAPSHSKNVTHPSIKTHTTRSHLPQSLEQAVENGSISNIGHEELIKTQYLSGVGNGMLDVVHSFRHLSC